MSNPRSPRDAEPTRDAEPAPFIVRIGGIPADAMKSFHSDLCAGQLEPASHLRERLRAARSDTADRIFGLLLAVEPALRRTLLAIKRDCFNGRPLLRRRASPVWSALRELVGPTIDRVLELEEAQARQADEYQRAYERVAARERQAIESLYQDRSLLRGVALASPVLIESLPRLGRGLRDKRQAHLEISLLRYASRAALKTSPFSTLTRLGIGTVAETAGSPSTVGLVDGNWQERSLVRLKRYVPDQDYALLSRYPRFRDRLRVAMNSSLWEPVPGRYCFIRPDFWAPQDGVMRYTTASLVQLELSGPLVAWLLREVPVRELTYAELVAALEQAFAADQPDRRIPGTLAKLLDIGFLRLLPPWPSNVGHLERHLLEHVRALADDPLLAAFGDTLARIVALQDGYAAADNPLESLRSMKHQVAELWQATRALEPATPAIERFSFDASAIYEDVFLQNRAGDDPWQAIARLSRQAAGDIIRSTRPLVLLTQLLSHRHELLHAITAFASERWPDRRLVGLVELMRDIQPLWRAYSSFISETSRLTGASQRAASFNPYELESVHELRRLRHEIWAEVERSLRHEQDEVQLAGAQLEAVLERVPRRYLPASAACLMIQPADSAGQRWMLNQLFEGTGRYGSRYTPVMPEPVRERYASHFSRRSTFAVPHAAGDLLDVVFSAGETLNIHALQTPSVLELFGESLDVRAGRKLTLGELFMCFDGPDQPPYIVDRAGRAYAPVHLGVADQTFMPFAVRLLSLFGPDELRLPMLPRNPVRRGEMTIWPRVTAGNVIIHRRRWTFPGRMLPREIARAPKHVAFAAVNQWRIEQEIPERVFIIEQIRSGHYKPQYLDFTSPLFVTIFLSILGKDWTQEVSMDEMIPTPDAFLADRGGRHWAVEIQLDTLAM